MPKASKQPPKVVYPPGVKEVTNELSTDDLVRRLKECAQAFQNMSQDEDNTAYVPLAMHLAAETFLEHSSKDVRLLIACCVADVFRVFAPEAPYKDPTQLKTIFEFFIDQLRGLEDPKDTIFKRYFYLLENLAWVKTFNICIELEENQVIFTKLFDLIFNIVNDNHSNKVKNFMLDMMCPLVIEADTISQQLLDIILMQIIVPRKTQNKHAYNLAKDILKRTAGTLEPYIHIFFNNALILGKIESKLSRSLYDLIYELNAICPSMLVAVLPQLEFKLKSSVEKERLDVTKLLARMFSDRNSDLASQNKALWTCFLGRFNDISFHVRIRCVQYAMHFLINHPELRPDITEQLRQRQHDPDETVRYEVVMAIISAAKKDFNSVTDDLLNFVKERTLDKKFKIRKEALLGLAMLYKQHMSNPDIPDSTRECISWIKNKVLHVYYQTALEDRLLVERILHTCLVPYQSSLEDRMKKLYQLFCTVDDHAIKAFNELLKCQNTVRNHVKDVLDILLQPKTDNYEKNVTSKIVVLSRSLPEPIKCQEYLKKFFALLENNVRLKSHMDTILKGTASCSEIEHSVKEVLKSLGLPVQTNSFYMIVKQMLERVAPVMIDLAGIKQLLLYIKDSLLGAGDVDIQLGLFNSAERGLVLLHTLSGIFPSAFCDHYVFEELLSVLRVDDEAAVDTTICIFSNIGSVIESHYPNICGRLLPLLQNFIEYGTVKQAKHAVGCMFHVVTNKERVFGQIIDHLKMNLTLQSEYFRTSLVSLGHIAMFCPDLFGMQIKSIVSKVIVKDLLMVDFEISRADDSMWIDYDMLPEETKVKVEGMKMIVRWLLGLKTASQSTMSTLRLLTTVILHRGDLMERGHVSPAEKSWLRLTAACCMLKLCQEPNYAEVISLEQFQVLSLVVNDECYQVRDRFSQKLNKGLMALKLPLDFLAIFALGGLEKTRELKAQFKQHLLGNINKRRDYLKQNPFTTVKLFSYLPDYVLPYVIHLLAHDPAFKKYDDIATLIKLKDCLWFLMEPLMKNENYSFSFFKRLIDAIKQTKDKQAPNDDIANLKLYAVCDLALSLVISKTTNFVLKDFPVEPTLPSKLYTEQDKSYCNLKTYLPAELIAAPPKKSGLELEMLFSNARNAFAKKPTTINNNNNNNNNVHTNISCCEGSSQQKQSDQDQLNTPSSSEEVNRVNEDGTEVVSDQQVVDDDSILSQEQSFQKTARSDSLERTRSASQKRPGASSPINPVVVKRPRGRPRKTPLPANHTVTASINLPSNSKSRENSPAISSAKRKKLSVEVELETPDDAKKARCDTNSAEIQEGQPISDDITETSCSDNKPDNLESLICQSNGENDHTNQDDRTKDTDSRLALERTDEEILRSCQEFTGETLQISETSQEAFVDTVSQSSSTPNSSQQGKRPTRRK